MDQLVRDGHDDPWVTKAMEEMGEPQSDEPDATRRRANRLAELVRTGVTLVGEKDDELRSQALALEVVYRVGRIVGWTGEDQFAEWLMEEFARRPRTGV